MREIPTFRIRCSSIGQIMTEPRGKSVKQKIADLYAKLAEQNTRLETIKPTLKSYGQQQERIAKTEAEIERLLPHADDPNLSTTCISFLEKWANEFVYERRVEFRSKMTDKGNIVEDDAIVYASGWVKEMGLSAKNEEKFRNDFLQGSPDVISDEYVFDTKCSWNHDTFPLYSTELPEADYDWQVKGYMALTGKTKGRVVYVLMSMPDEMIEREARWKLGQEYTTQEFNDFAAQFRYDDLPPELRLKEFEVEWDEDAIAAIEKRVQECRNYIKSTIIPALQSNVKKYEEQ